MLILHFVCVQLGTGQEIFQLTSSPKVCHYLGGDQGEGGQGKRGQSVTREFGGSDIRIFTFLMVP